MSDSKLEQFLKRRWPYLVLVMLVIVVVQTGWLIWMQFRTNDSGGGSRADSSFNSLNLGSSSQGLLPLLPDDPFKI